MWKGEWLIIWSGLCILLVVLMVGNWWYLIRVDSHISIFILNFSQTQLKRQMMRLMAPSVIHQEGTNCHEEESKKKFNSLVVKLNLHVFHNSVMLHYITLFIFSICGQSVTQLFEMDKYA